MLKILEPGNKTRIIEFICPDCHAKFISLGGSEKWSKDGASNLPPFLSKKVLKPFITAELSVPLSSPIEFRPLHG